MTKQKEIREGIDDALYKCRGGWLTIIELKQKLSDLGVVLQVDGKLPSIFNLNEDVISALEYKKKLDGYVLVESIIEEKE